MRASRICLLALVSSALSLAEGLEIFDNPEKACRLLVPEGFPRAPWLLVQGWREFQCSAAPGSPVTSAPKPTSHMGGIPEGTIVFIVSGNYPDQVTRLKLLVHLSRNGDNEPLLAKFEGLAAKMLVRIGLPMQDELRGAIRNLRPFRHWQDRANVTFDPHTMPVLIVRDPRVRVVPIPRANL